MRLEDGVHKVRRVVVLRIGRAVCTESLAKQRVLIGMEASGRVKIYLLEKHEIGRERLYSVPRLADAIKNTLKALCSRLLSAVHKEGKLRGIRAKADVLRDDGVFLAKLRLVLTLGAIDIAIKLVGESLVAAYNVKQIRKHGNKKNGDHGCQNFKCQKKLFHMPLPPFKE